MAINSTPPLAPSRWPSMLLVLLMASLRACVAEHFLDRLRLRRVAQRRAGAVGVDVLHVLGVELGVAAGRAAWPWPPRRRSGCGAVMWWASAVLPSRASRRRWSRRACGRAPAPRGRRCRRPRSARSRRGPCRTAGWRACGSSLRMDRARADDEAAQAHRRDGRLRAAGQHDVGVSVLDGAHGVADGVAGRGAGRRNGRVRPRQAELDRDVARRRVGDHLGNDERADAAGAALDDSGVCCSSNSFSPPMPLPMMTPQRYGSSLAKSMPLSLTA